MKIELKLGVFAKRISEQLGDLLTEQAAFHLDKDNDSINRLSIRGYLSSNSKMTMRKKLIKNCVAAINDNQNNSDYVYSANTSVSDPCPHTGSTNTNPRGEKHHEN